MKNKGVQGVVCVEQGGGRREVVGRVGKREVVGRWGKGRNQKGWEKEGCWKGIS